MAGDCGEVHERILCNKVAQTSRLIAHLKTSKNEKMKMDGKISVKDIPELSLSKNRFKKAANHPEKRLAPSMLPLFGINLSSGSISQSVT